jgi:hypothetical protein
MERLQMRALLLSPAPRIPPALPAGYEARRATGGTRNERRRRLCPKLPAKRVLNTSLCQRDWRLSFPAPSLKKKLTKAESEKLAA